jgi:glucose 1-dehydrogenase
VQLENKIAIVTGGTSGIGRAIALAFGAAGASVTVNFRKSPEAADEVVGQLEAAGGKGLAVHADVTKAGEVGAMVARTVEEFGRLDVMVNNAGMETKMPFLETPLEVWEEVLAVNLTGPWLGCQAAARQMVGQNGGGRIVNISSVHEDLPMPTNAPYCAAKGGVRMLTRTIAVELAPHGVTANNIAPGAVETPMDAEIKEDPEQYESLLSEIPLGRMGKPEEVAALAVYLASDAAAYVTGSTFVVDGGMMRRAGSL